jgi:hypothetical protein
VKSFLKNKVDAIVHTMVRIPEIKTKEIIEFVVQTEVKQSETPGTLFRRNSLATKMIGAVLATYGRKFLKQLLEEFIINLNKENEPLEVDPNKVKSPEEAEKNMLKLQSIIEGLIEKLINSVNDIPMYIIVLF